MPKCNPIFVIKGNKAGFCEYESSSRVTQCNWVIVLFHCGARDGTGAMPSLAPRVSAPLLRGVGALSSGRRQRGERGRGISLCFSWAAGAADGRGMRGD